MPALSVPDDHRVDPTNAIAWHVKAAGRWTIVVATCAEEARRLGLVWIAESYGRTSIKVNTTATVQPATDDDIDRWLTARRQDAAGAVALRRGTDGAAIYSNATLPEMA